MTKRILFGLALISFAILVAWMATMKSVAEQETFSEPLAQATATPVPTPAPTQPPAPEAPRPMLCIPAPMAPVGDLQPMLCN